MDEIRLYDAQDIHYASLNAEEVYQEETRGDHPGIWRWTKPTFEIKFSKRTRTFLLILICNLPQSTIEIRSGKFPVCRYNLKLGKNSVLVELEGAVQTVSICTYPILVIDGDPRNLGICLQSAQPILPSQYDGRMIWHMHLPKCAGTSIDNFFIKVFGEEHCLTNGMDFCSPFGLSNFPDGQLFGYNYISGHFNVGLSLRFGMLNKVFIILRDPVQRVVSQYFHNKNWKGPSGVVALCQKFSLESLLAPENRQLARTAGLSNFMSDFLLGMPLAGIVRHNLSEDYALNVIKCYMKEMLAVGFLDDLPGIVSLVLKKSNIPFCEPFQEKSNVGSYPKCDDKKLLQLIYDANKLDCAVYEWARQEFAHK